MENTRKQRDQEVEALHGKTFDLLTWIGKEMAGDMGSVGNKEVFKHSDFIFMIIKGPNRRNDYHVNMYDEVFYQLEGTVEVGLIDEEGHPHTAVLNAGEVLLVKAYTPHQPRRPAGTVGLVVERPRTPNELDGIVWHCDQCHNKLHEVQLLCQDIEINLKEALDQFNDNLELRTCGKCGAVLPDPRA